ncbi:MAG: heme ABC transporter ATP-binding protein [Bacteroidota bacterium]
MIRVENISVQKGGKQIVKSVSFQITPGKITVVIGKNGAGKSTLLEALTAANPINSGTILWDGQALSTISQKILAMRRAVLSQKIDLSFAIPVKNLVELGTYVSDEPIPPKKMETLIHNSLKEVDLLQMLERDFNTLSGGEQKRVLLAKCMVQLNCCHWADVNKYLFLDEPTASLDIEQQFHFIATIKQLVKRRNIGVFAVLHDINLAAQFADEIIMLRDGQLLEQGAPTEVLTPDKLACIFDIQAIVQTHPVFDCPHITVLPKDLAKASIHSLSKA